MTYIRDWVVSRGKVNAGDAMQASTIHPIILLYNILFMGEIGGHDCTGGEIDGRGSFSTYIPCSTESISSIHLCLIYRTL
jgi:hypothetical protein